MATRVIEDRRERLITILVSPLMTCSARLPVYTVAIGVLIPEAATVGPFGARGLTLLALYVGGALFGSLAAWVLGRTVLRGRRDSPILEMPPYRWPEGRAVVARVANRGVSFLKRAGTVIFGISILLWFLSTYPRVDAPSDATPAEAAAAQLHGSFAGRAGRWIEPVIDPLGFDWRVGIGLLASFAAREVFVSTMGVVYAVGSGDAEVSEAELEGAFRTALHDGTTVPVFGIASLVALLLFYMIAPQCVSTLAIIRREAGSWGWALLAFGYLTVLAYAVAWAGRQIVLAFVG
jgi:ferrous iron transport protein B